MHTQIKCVFVSCASASQGNISWNSKVSTTPCGASGGTWWPCWESYLSACAWPTSSCDESTAGNDAHSCVHKQQSIFLSNLTTTTKRNTGELFCIVPPDWAFFYYYLLFQINLYCKTLHLKSFTHLSSKVGMSDSFYIPGHMLPTLMLSGPH